LVRRMVAPGQLVHAGELDALVVELPFGVAAPSPAR
jgi:hypothetical protein